jgi:hypothetical protein
VTALYAVPSFCVLVGTIALAVALAAGGQILVHRHFKASDFVRQNEVAGFIIAVVGTLYAVVLGFVTIVVWQQYEGARDRVSVEAASVADAWHNAVGLPPAVRSRVRRDMLEYAATMKTQEWPLMRSGGMSPRGDELIMDATSTVGLLVPANAGQSNAQSATLKLLSDLHEMRQRRLGGNESPVSGFQWAVLLIGAAMVIGFCYLFGMGNERVHVLMTSSVAVIVATMFTLVFELQYPFRSDLGITPAAWTGVMRHIDAMDMGPPGMRMGG